jgi:hypothetical protein
MTNHWSPCWLLLFQTISYTDCSLLRLSSSRQDGCVVLEVVGCWPESLANQRWGLGSGTEEVRVRQKERPNAEKKRNREKGEQGEQKHKEKKRKEKKK